MNLPLIADPGATGPAGAAVLQMLAETSPLGVIGFDAGLAVVYRNPVAARWAEPDWQGHADDRPGLIAARQSLTTAGDRYEQIYRWVSAAGGLRWIKETAQRLAETVEGICVIAHQADITDALDQATGQSQRLLRQEGLVRCAADPILTLDADLQVLSCNHAAERLLGAPATDIEGRPLGRWLCTEEAPALSLTVGTGQAMTLRHAHGATIPVTASISLLQLRGDTFYTVIVRDAREQVRLQQQLAAAQVQQRLVLQAAGMGSWQRDVDARRLRVSAEARAVLGCAAQELLEDFEHLILHIHPADRDAVSAQWQQAIDQGLPYEQAYRVIVAEGETRWIGERGLCLAAPQQRRLLAVVMDVTEQRQREAELAAMAERLRALGAQLVQVQEHERRHLARELHDEIGQQLTAALIELRDPALRLPQALRTRWTEQFGGLIEQVRTLSLDLSPAMLVDLGLVPALRGYAQRQATLGGLSLSFSADEGLGRCAPEIENALFRIAQEATTNVLRHASATRLTVSLTQAAGALHLVIADDGVGLPADPAETARHFGMMGMRERAALLGGTLRLASRAGRGLSIEARIPVGH